MELTQENVNNLAEVLRSNRFNESLEQVQNMIDVARDLITRYPEASLEELHEIFEREQEELLLGKETEPYENTKALTPDEKDIQDENDER